MTLSTANVRARVANPARRRRAVIFFVVAYIVAHLAVPTVLLPGREDRAFGWQMYSTAPDHRFEVDFPDGSTEIVDPEEFVLRYRSEADYSADLPPFLCRRIPDATQVRTVGIPTDHERVHRCG